MSNRDSTRAVEEPKRHTLRYYILTNSDQSDRISRPLAQPAHDVSCTVDWHGRVGFLGGLGNTACIKATWTNGPPRHARLGQSKASAQERASDQCSCSLETTSPPPAIPQKHGLSSPWRKAVVKRGPFVHRPGALTGTSPIERRLLYHLRHDKQSGTAASKPPDSIGVRLVIFLKSEDG
jgi:hypothetical protein